jgi:hypothetical protein
MIIIRETLISNRLTANLSLICDRKAAMYLLNRWVMEVRLSDTPGNVDERLLEDYEIKKLVTDRPRELESQGITCQIVNIYNSPD